MPSGMKFEAVAEAKALDVVPPFFSEVSSQPDRKTSCN